ncbi:hypothetical protein L1987_28618 [Smallanthus sonchifolius]|uniref:Uncharacterized protein n=1 Tax=Smallanthus sonchifolius TaxID=185202 RepID=A0ACB9HXI8_9ASTR|nr:hypothetical protein L1987_28618 [Smallanthus sonchifolius]
MNESMWKGNESYKGDVLFHVTLRGIPVTHPILVAHSSRTHKSCDSHVWFHMLHTHPIPNRPHPCQFLHTSARKPNLAGKYFPPLSTPAGTTGVMSQRLRFSSGGC